jgi:hypothetical protein
MKSDSKEFLNLLYNEDMNYDALVATIPNYNTERFNAHTWSRNSPNAHSPLYSWYGRHDTMTLNRLHALLNPSVNTQNQHPIIGAHDNGLLSFLHDQANVEQIHRQTSFVMTLQDFILHGLMCFVFNEGRYPYHRSLVKDMYNYGVREDPWRLHNYERQFMAMNGVKPGDPGLQMRGDLQYLVSPFPIVGRQPAAQPQPPQHQQQQQQQQQQQPGLQLVRMNNQGQRHDDDGLDDDYDLVGGSAPRAHLAMQSQEARNAARIARTIVSMRTGRG